MQDEGRFRKALLQHRRIAEKTSIFLSLFIIFLGVVFATRPREIILKQQILTGLGAALNICIAAEFSLKGKWVLALIAVTAAMTAVLLLVGKIVITAIG